MTENEYPDNFSSMLCKLYDNQILNDQYVAIVITHQKPSAAMYALIHLQEHSLLNPITVDKIIPSDLPLITAKILTNDPNPPDSLRRSAAVHPTQQWGTSPSDAKLRDGDHAMQDYTTSFDQRRFNGH